MIDLTAEARALGAVPKGILAADESNTTADKRLAQYGIATGHESRQAFRELFLETEGIENFLSGVILFSETLEEKNDAGVLFADSLIARGIMVGIKVDEGVEPLPQSPEESITKGLIGLPERLQKYKETYHASFTKWRAVIKIHGDELPSAQAISENAKRLALYARQVQEAGMVPILEPEVLYEGVHSRMRSREVIEETLRTLVSALTEHAVDLSGVVIKTAMALSGKETGKIDSPEDVAHDTVEALLASVPKEIPSIVFLSGGQETEQATNNLEAIVREGIAKEVPWSLTFSFARALQDEALEAWKGKPENVAAARSVFLERLEKTHSAMHG